MSEKSKNLVLAVLVVGLISMTIAFATLSQTLTVSGTSTLKSGGWNVHFAAVTSGSATSANSYAAVGATSITFNTGSTTATMPLATIKAPGGTVTYRFQVKNEGSINAKISGTPSISLGTGTMATNQSVPTEVSGKMSVTMTYDDNTEIKTNDTLNAGTAKVIKVIVKYDSSATSLPSGEVSYPSITASINYVQA